MRTTLLFAVLTGVFVLGSLESEAAETCIRKATSFDVKALQGKISEGDCVDRATEALIRPGLSGAAKEYLKSLPKQFAGSSSYDCKTYEDKNIDKLEGKFAICAANFLKAYAAAGNHVVITSAYRSYEEQVCVCKGETGLCGRALPLDKSGRPIGGRGIGHQYGTAMDVRAADTPGGGPSQRAYERMHAFARANPQYGIHFPFGMTDRPHMEPTGGECGTGNFSPGPAGGVQPPTSGIADAVRQWATGEQGRSGAQSSSASNQCTQLDRACKEGGHSACMQFAQQCQQGAAPPHVPQGRAPTGAGTAGVPSQGTQGISQAFAPPTPPTPPTAPLVNSPVSTGTSSALLATTAPTISESIASIVVTPPHATPTTTPQNPLPTTIVTYLAEEQVRITPTVGAPLPPPTTIPPRYTPPMPTFGEASFDVQARTHTFDSTARYTAIAQQLARARLLAEGLLHYVPQPFSSDRYWAEHNESE